MDNLICIILIISSVILSIIVSSAKQAQDSQKEKVIIKYANPKYTKDMKLAYGHLQENGQFCVNISVTTLQTFGNNVTIRGVVSRGSNFTIEQKLCHLTNFAWMKTFIKMFSNVQIDCPYPPGVYNFVNTTFPPRNYPLPLSKGYYNAKLLWFLTRTKETIMDLEMVFRARR